MCFSSFSDNASEKVTSSIVLLFSSDNPIIRRLTKQNTIPKRKLMQNSLTFSLKDGWLASFFRAAFSLSHKSNLCDREITLFFKRVF